MHVFQAFEALVNDVLLVNVLQDDGPNDRMKVCVHKVENQVNISVVFSSNDILKSDDVFMPIQLLQKHHFSESPLRISSILEGIKVLL